MYNILCSTANSDIPGGARFVWQCIVFLARENLLVFTALSLMVLLLCVIFKDLMEVLEDGGDRRKEKRHKRRK